MEQESHQTEEFQSPSIIPTPCANNCGFFGSSATNNLCSKCYRDHFLTKSKASIDSVAVAAAAAAAAAATSVAVEVPLIVDAAVEEKAEVNVQAGDTSVKKPANRCGACNKRVGLMGFKCRCGEVLCSVHRYSDEHGCLFDYKGAAQDAIAKANPVVKPDKVDKI